MSIVVAVRKNGRTVMAADTLTTFGQERLPTDNCRVRKILRIGESLMSVTGWAVYANILDDVLAGETPKLGNEAEIFSFFMELWRKLHDNYAFVNDQSQEKDSPFGDLDASFLIANAAGIYKVAQDSSVTRFERYYAIGSGAVYSLGALHQIWDGPDDAPTLARKAVQTALEFDVYCGAPIDVEEVAPVAV